VGNDDDLPELTGPLDGDAIIFSQTSFDLADVGYVQEEFLVEGTATSYTPAAPLTADGLWDVEPSGEADYATRIVVNRPMDEADFNGTVVVEWLNVSGGVDASPDWMQAHVELIRGGYAWVGVSAQQVGVDALKGEDTGDPGRYDALDHPGDSYAFDLFTQAGRAVVGADVVLGGMEPERVLAVGESQSAFALVTYIDAVHPREGVYDGYLVHSRGPGGLPLSQEPEPVTPPQPTRIRSDLDVPVLVFLTENDFGIASFRQPDTDRYRHWEVAGTSHFDLYGLAYGAADIGELDTVEEWLAVMQEPTNQPSGGFTCDKPINTGPHTYVLRAAFAALNEWVADGTLPPVAPRFETADTGPAENQRDENGNVVGGIRTPAVDAPLATLSGFGQSGELFCGLFGVTTPLAVDRLVELYGDHDGFVDAWHTATGAALDAGFLLPDDVALIGEAAEQSDVLRDGTG
jgi:hypothetical protein